MFNKKKLFIYLLSALLFLTPTAFASKEKEKEVRSETGIISSCEKKVVVESETKEIDQLGEEWKKIDKEIKPCEKSKIKEESFVMPNIEEIKKRQKKNYLFKTKIRFGTISEQSKIYKYVEDVYKEILNDLKSKKIDIENYDLILTDNESINAFIDRENKIININWGLLDLLRKKGRLNKSALKFILGHEVGHIVFNMNQKKNKKVQESNLNLYEEYFADQYGLRLLDQPNSMSKKEKDNPIEGMNILKLFEEIERSDKDVGNDDELEKLVTMVTASHPLTHRRKIKAYHEINSNYWENLFLDDLKNKNAPDLETLGFERSQRFNFEKELFENISIDSLKQKIDKAENLQQINQITELLKISTFMNDQLEKCEDNLSSDNIDISAIVGEVLEETDYYLQVYEKNSKKKQMPLVNLGEKFLVDSKVSQKDVNQKCAKSLQKKIDLLFAGDEKKHQLTKKYFKANKEILLYKIVAKSLLYKKAKKEENRLSWRKEKKENKKQEGFREEIMRPLNEHPDDKSTSQELIKIVSNKIKMILDKKDDGGYPKLSDEERMTIANLLFSANPSKIPYKLAYILNKELVERDVGKASFIDSLPRGPKYQRSYGNIDWIRELQSISSVIAKTLATEIENGLTSQNSEDDMNSCSKKIVDYLIENNGYVDLNYCKLLAQILEKSKPKMDDFLKFMQLHIGSINKSSSLGCFEEPLNPIKPSSPSKSLSFDFKFGKETTDDNPDVGSFMDKLIAYPLNKENLKKFFNMLITTKGTKTAILKELYPLLAKALKKGILKSEDDVFKFLDQIITESKIKNNDEYIHQTIEKFLAKVGSSEEKISLLKKCPNCNTYKIDLTAGENEGRSKFICIEYIKDVSKNESALYNCLNECANSGIWFDPEYLKKLSLEKQKQIFQEVLKNKQQYKTLTTTQLDEFFATLNWNTNLDKNLELSQNKDFLKYLNPSDNNRYLFYSETMSNKNPLGESFERNPFAAEEKKIDEMPTVFKTFADDPKNMNSDKGNNIKCDELIKFSKYLYGEYSNTNEKSEHSDSFLSEDFSLKDIGDEDILDQQHEAPSCENFWDNFREKKFYILLPLMKNCLELDKDINKKISTILKLFDIPSNIRNSLLVKVLAVDPLKEEKGAFQYEKWDQKITEEKSDTIFDLLTEGPLKEIIAKKIILEKIKQGVVKFKNYNDVKKVLDRFFKNSTPIKKELFSELLQDITMSVDELISYQENEQKDVVKEANSDNKKKMIVEIFEKIGNEIEDLDSSEKIGIFTWLIGKGEKPKKVLDFEKIWKLNLDDYPNYLANASENERFDIVSRLFLGPKGIFANSKNKESLLQDIYGYLTIGKKDRPRNDILYTVFSKLFKVSPETKQITLMHGLFSGLLKNRNKIEENLSEKEKLERKDNAIKDLLVSFGTVGIKLGQVLSKRSEIKGEHFKKVLGELSDNVKAIDKRFILNALKRDNVDTKKIKAINKKLGSASLKQVYSVTLGNGKEKVLKFNRPMAYYEIPENMAIIRKLFKVKEIKEKLPLSEGLLDAIEKGAMKELKIEKEMKNQMEISSFIKGHANKINSWHLVVPKVDKKLKGQHVYVDQFAKGKALLKNDLIKSMGEEDKKNVAKLVYTSLIQQIFTYGKYHADLHPGNILIDTDKKEVHLIDFGSCAKLKKENRELFYDLLFNLIHKNDKKTLSTLKNMLAHNSGNEKSEDQKKFEKLEKALTLEVKKIVRKSDGEDAKISQKITLIKKILDTNGIAFDPEFEVLLKIFDTTSYISDILSSEDIEKIFFDEIGKYQIGKRILYNLLDNCLCCLQSKE
ncbi:MAG: M48 family metalloprotease [Oligoflexia bacterium]|nr:M48 family metalloprotease [Oligoflexia bacterium]